MRPASDARRAVIGRRGLLHRIGAWLETRRWWGRFANWIDRRILTPPWERRERPIDALVSARARIARDSHADDLPLLREIDWCIWVMGRER